ncbi:MAG: hypothetical protein Q4Q53_04240 [Methanocorpusculum sp.]|nr:hypothetical protein [Methanocorpusculum sp.]
MKRTEQIIVYIGYALLAVALLFFALPALNYPSEVDLFVLVIVNIAVCVLVSVILGLVTGISKLSIIYPIMVGLLFYPTAFIFYNDSALIYVPVYIIICVVAVCVGWLINPKGLI